MSEETQDIGLAIVERLNVLRTHLMHADGVTDVLVMDLQFTSCISGTRIAAQFLLDPDVTGRFVEALLEVGQ